MSESFWTNFAIILGSSWDHFAIILNLFGICMGSFWDKFETILGYCSKLPTLCEPCSLYVRRVSNHGGQLKVTGLMTSARQTRQPSGRRWTLAGSWFRVGFVGRVLSCTINASSARQYRRRPLTCIYIYIHICG